MHVETDNVGTPREVEWEDRKVLTDVFESPVVPKEGDMSHPEEYDVVILGSGAAGNLLAWTLAPQGKRTAVVERRYVWGACPNISCLLYRLEFSGRGLDGTHAAADSPLRRSRRT